MRTKYLVLQNFSDESDVEVRVQQLFANEPLPADVRCEDFVTKRTMRLELGVRRASPAWSIGNWSSSKRLGCRMRASRTMRPRNAAGVQRGGRPSRRALRTSGLMCHCELRCVTALRMQTLQHMRARDSERNGGRNETPRAMEDLVPHNRSLQPTKHGSHFEPRHGSVLRAKMGS